MKLSTQEVKTYTHLEVRETRRYNDDYKEKDLWSYDKSEWTVTSKQIKDGYRKCKATFSKNITPEMANKVIRSKFHNTSCSCNHDCCGCYFATVSGFKPAVAGKNTYVFLVASYRGY